MHAELKMVEKHWSRDKDLKTFNLHFILFFQIIGTPKYISFLHILQDLLKLELDDEQIDRSVNFYLFL